MPVGRKGNKNKLKPCGQALSMKTPQNCSERGVDLTWSGSRSQVLFTLDIDICHWKCLNGAWVSVKNTLEALDNGNL